MGDAKAKQAEVSQRDLDKGLWVAASEGNLKEVQALKGKGANPMWFNPWEPPGRGMQFNALHVASGGGHIEIVKYLVETCKVDFRAKCRALAAPTCLSLRSHAAQCSCCFREQNTVRLLSSTPRAAIAEAKERWLPRSLSNLRRCLRAVCH